jgi:hypothetical protein
MACRYWAGRVALRETARSGIVPQIREEVNRRGVGDAAAGGARAAVDIPRDTRRVLIRALDEAIERES